MNVALVQRVSTLYIVKVINHHAVTVCTMMSSGLSGRVNAEGKVGGGASVLDILIDLSLGGCLASGLHSVIEDRHHSLP